MTVAAGQRDDDAEKGSQRLDKWLWFARVTKSRTLASGAVTEGKIKVNRVRAGKPSQLVKVGDVVTSRVHRTIRVLRIVALGERRGPAAEAMGLYEDLTPPSAENNSLGTRRPGNDADGAGDAWGYRDPGSGRPSKRERRQTDSFRRSED
jgi:ribosome-associated heat shock protein Hsp15